VRLAEQELARGDEGDHDERRWASVRAALERARRLRQEGNAGEADAVLAALEALYRDDPSAGDVLAEMRRERGQ
jgi:hypothetical protein